MKNNELVLWHEFDGVGDHSIQVLEERCATFYTETGIRVVPQVMNIRELQYRMENMGRLEDTPDIAFVPSDMLYHANNGSFSVLDNNTIELDIDPIFNQSMQLEGTQYGVPLLAGNHLVLYYNQEIFPQAPGCWQQLQDATASLCKRNITPIGSDCEDPYWYVPFLTAHDGWVMEGESPMLFDQGNAEALAFVNDMIERATLANLAGSTDLLDQFIAGRIGCIISGEWIFNYLSEKMGDNLGVAALPKVNQKPMISMSSTIGFVFPCQSLSSFKRDSILRFVNYMLSESSQLKWTTDVQRIPVNPQVVEKIQQVSSENKKTILKQMKNSRSIPSNYKMKEIWKAIDLGLTTCLSKKYSPKESAALMQVYVDVNVAQKMADLL